MILHSLSPSSNGDPCSVYSLDLALHLNSSLEGFFTSARGIRHGCSFSPYLYVTLSNVLSKLLNQAVEAGRFSYHPQCQGVKLTHLSFTDFSIHQWHIFVLAWGFGGYEILFSYVRASY